ncbi:MAG: helix-turn-helix domain-containing protein [Phycisphaera sp.]|nr:MAG: helix-turn-helix domain-containing protein [Phycisphaera sp.]
MPRETSTTQAAKQLGVTPRVLQQWVKNRRAPHGHNPNGTRIRFDVGEVRAWAVQKGLLSASDQKAKAGNSKSGKRGRNTQGADSKSKPSKSKPKGGKGKPEPPDPPGDTPQVDTSPEGRRKTAFEILAKIPGLLSELNTSDGSLAASQVATAIKSAEATAAAMLRRLDLEAERDETLIDRNKAVRVAVEIGTIVSAGSKAAVVDLSDRLYDDLVAAGIKPGPREAFVRVVRGTIRDSEDKRMLEVGEAVRRAEVGLNGR